MESLSSGSSFETAIELQEEEERTERKRGAQSKVCLHIEAKQSVVVNANESVEDKTHFCQ